MARPDGLSQPDAPWHPALRVALDARLLAYQQAGIGTYVRGLLDGFGALSARLRLTVVLSRKQPDGLRLPSWPRFVRAWTPPHHRYERLTFGLEVARLGVDVLHSPDFIPPRRPFGPKHSVITVHDLAFLRYPDLLTPASHRYYGQIYHAVGEADVIVAVSACTRRDLIAEIGADPAKIVVIPEAARPDLRPVPDDASRRAALERLGLDRPYFVFVGTIEPRKNLTMLLESYALLRGRLGPTTPLLAIAGRRGWLSNDVFRTAERLRLGTDVRFLGPIADVDLPALLSGALALVFPSLYEGFGLPPLEAMTCGTPVVVANAGALPEVVGDAGLLVPPRDVAAWADRLAQVAEDATLRDHLRTKGLARAAHFTWRRAAWLTLHAYQRAAGLPIEEQDDGEPPAADA